MRYFILIFLLLITSSAEAQRIPGSQNFGRTCHGGAAVCAPVPLSPKRIFNFMAGIPPGFTFGRGSTATYFDSSGILQTAAINEPRFDYGSPGSTTLQGLFIESSATNKLLDNRDLTNPAWTQVTAIVAMDQTGIDNLSNSSSSFLALGVNSTVCQIVTQAATNAVFSVYLKRLVGTGNVAISQDNGTSYATVTLTSSWKRFQHVNQTTLNPGACIRLATSADQIAVDYAQLENVSNSQNRASSPIATTTTAVTRSGDSLSMPINSPTGATDAVNQWMNLTSGAFVAEWEMPYNNFVFNGAFGLSNANVSINNGNVSIPQDLGGASICTNSGSHPANFVYKTGATYSRTYFRNSCKSGSSNVLTYANPASITAFNVMVDAYLRKFTYWNYPLTTAQLVAQTQ